MARENSEDRKGQIIQAAMEIISEEGVQKLTMMQISKRVGVTDAALYKHFRNKKEIILAMIDEVGRALTTFISQQVASYANPVEKLQQVLKLHLAYLERNKGIPRILFSEAIHVQDPDLKKRTATMINNYMDLIHGILYRAVQEGHVRKDLEIDAAAIAFLGLIQGSVILWSLNDFSFSLAERHTALWRVFAESLK